MLVAGRVVAERWFDSSPMKWVRHGGTPSSEGSSGDFGSQTDCSGAERSCHLSFLAGEGGRRIGNAAAIVGNLGTRSTHIRVAGGFLTGVA